MTIHCCNELAESEKVEGGALVANGGFEGGAMLHSFTRKLPSVAMNSN